MNRAEQYRADVDRKLEGLSHVSTGPAPTCDRCLDCPNPEDPSGEWYDLANEPSFSRHPCDGCGAQTAGNRYPAHGAATWPEQEGNIFHLEVCRSCVLYLSGYGAEEALPEEGQ